MTSTKLYLGLLESSLPGQTRIFAALDGKLVDLSLACASYLAEIENNRTHAYELAGYFFPETISKFLARGDPSLTILDKVVAFTRKNGVQNLCGPAKERVVYEPAEIRMLPPTENPEKSFVIGFSDKARTEAMPRAEIPTAYYKLPQTFVASGAPIVWPIFSEEVDADACLAIVIGKAGRRIPLEKAWDHVAGATLVIDVTARDINKREGLTTNNLLGKNFPSSTSVGPAVLLTRSKRDLEEMTVELALDGVIQQKFALRDCVFTAEQIIAYWSTVGVKPGDWLAIGASLALQGNRLQNPVRLKVGSTIRCSAPAIGELSHQVVSSGGIRR